MPRLTVEMKASINSAHLDGVSLVLAVVDREGRPLLSFRGSAQAYDDETLAMWIRKPESSAALAALRANPQVALVYSDMATHRRRVGWMFSGRARVVDDAAVRETVCNNADEPERSRDPEMTGAAVLVDLDEISGFPLD